MNKIIVGMLSVAFMATMTPSAVANPARISRRVINTLQEAIQNRPRSNPSKKARRRALNCAKNTYDGFNNHNSEYQGFSRRGRACHKVGQNLSN